MMYSLKLTENERCLLHEHKACLKCWVFYAGYQANKCTITLSSKDYREHMLQDALHTKATKSTSWAPPIASITELPSNTPAAPDLVAALFPQSTSLANEYNISDTPDTSLSSVSAVPPLKGKHFTWDCSLTHDTGHIQMKVRALIDSGAHLVLIWPDIVTCLQLPKLLLPHPEQVSVAISKNCHDHTDTYLFSLLSFLFFLIFPHYPHFLVTFVTPSFLSVPVGCVASVSWRLYCTITHPRIPFLGLTHMLQLVDPILCVLYYKYLPCCSRNP